MPSRKDTHSILRLKAKDAQDLAALERECFSSGWTEEQYRVLLSNSDEYKEQTDSLPHNVVWGIRISTQELAAYISIGVDLPDATLELYNIAVRQQFRRDGLAKTLLSHALQWGRGYGFKRFLLEVRENNMPAISLYTQAGFTEQGRRKKYYSDTGEDALLFVCYLQDYSPSCFFPDALC